MFSKSVPINVIGKLMLLLTLLIFPLMTITSQPAQGSTPNGAVFLSPAEVVLYAKDQDSFTHVARRAEFTRGPQNATINVAYSGFSTEAQNAFQFAVDIWESQISSDVPIEIEASFEALPSGVLGSAGAAGLIANWTSGNPPPRSDTFYPIPLANKLAGEDLIPPSSPNADHDITARFSSVRSDWYFGTDGNPPAGRIDFVSVVLHEIGHGLGFSGSGRVSDGQGTVGLSSGIPTIYDLFVENGSGQAITSFSSPSSALATQLQGGDLFFDGTNAVAANGGEQPELYAPNPFRQGSSYSHLDEVMFPAGHANSLMTPSIGSAEAIHDPGDITRGIFQDMGWTIKGNTAPTPTPTSAPNDAPTIEVDPSALSSTQLPDRSVVQTLNIRNTGTGTLNWTIEESPNTVLLDVSDASSDRETDLPDDVNNLLGARSSTTESARAIVPSDSMAKSRSGAIELTLDDGSSGQSIGFRGQFVWLNRFTPNSADYPMSLNEIWIQFGRGGVSAGDAIDIVVHEDTDGDGNPGTGASHLATYHTQVGVADSSSWSRYTLRTPLVLNGAGDVLIGVVNRYSFEGNNDYPARLDTNSSQGRSWVGSYLAGNAPDQITYPADEQWDTIDSFDLPGNWMIRGIASAGGAERCASGNISWATVSPSSGSTSAGNSSEVSVTFNSTGLAAGTYSGNLCIKSNDLQNGQIEVPLRLVVEKEDEAVPTPTPTRTPTPTPTRTPPPTVNLTVDHIELTQSIQRTDNSVPLVADRPTIMRVFVEVQNRSSSVNGVTARLHAARNGTELENSPIAPFNSGGTFRAPLSPSRSEFGDSLNFQLPTDWTSAGELTLWVEVNPSRTVPESNYEDNRSPNDTFTFQNIPPLEVVLIPIAYQPNGSGPLYRPNMNASNNFGLGMLQRIYPIANIQYSIHSEYLFKGDLSTNAGWSMLLEEIVNLRSRERPNTKQFSATGMPKYYGVLPTEARGPWAGLAYIGGTAGIGLVEQNYIAPHELAHNLGLSHVNCGGPSGIDANYPYANGLIGNVGIDIYERTLIYASNNYDLMSYCFPQWISDYNYRKIYDVLAAASGLRESTQEEQTGWLISGRIYPDQSATLDHIEPISSTLVVEDAGVGRYDIELLDQSDVVRFRYRFNPTEIAAESDIPLPSDFTFIVPQIENLGRIQLKQGDKILATLEAATAAPSLKASQSAGSGGNSDELTISWETSSRRPGETKVNLRYSADGGETWQMLAMGNKDSSLNLSKNQLPGSENGLIEVIATNSTKSQTSRLEVGEIANKAPQVGIMFSDTLQYDQGEPIILNGAALDLEDGGMTDNHLVWSESTLGQLGTGQTLLLAKGLDAGTYTINLTATDSSGNRAEDRVTVTVHEREINHLYLPIIIQR